MVDIILPLLEVLNKDFAIVLITRLWRQLLPPLPGIAQCCCVWWVRWRMQGSHFPLVLSLSARLRCPRKQPLVLLVFALQHWGSLPFLLPLRICCRRQHHASNRMAVMGRYCLSCDFIALSYCFALFLNMNCCNGIW